MLSRFVIAVGRIATSHRLPIGTKVYPESFSGVYPESLARMFTPIPNRGFSGAFWVLASNSFRMRGRGRSGQARGLQPWPRSPDAGVGLNSAALPAARHGINPFDYLKDLFTRLPSAKITEIRQFTPSQWAKTQSDRGCNVGCPQPTEIQAAAGFGSSFYDATRQIVA